MASEYKHFHVGKLSETNENDAHWKGHMVLHFDDDKEALTLAMDILRQLLPQHDRSETRSTKVYINNGLLTTGVE